MSNINETIAKLLVHDYLMNKSLTSLEESLNFFPTINAYYHLASEELIKGNYEQSINYYTSFLEMIKKGKIPFY